MKRSPWVAVLLSGALPGLGHVYLGEPRRGLTLFAALGGVSVVAILTLLYLPVAPLNVLLPLGMVVTVWLYVLADAFRRGRRIEAYAPRRYNRWWVYLGAFLFVGFVAQPAAQNRFEASVSDAFRVTSAAMAPTLLPGDYLLVDKRSFRKRPPARFEMAVYRRGGTSYLHRIVGLPGDTLAMVGKVLHLNGAPVAEPYARHGDPLDVTAPAMRWQLDHLVDGDGRTATPPTRDDWGPLLVPEGRYFVLGDNRDDSADSRYHGFVAREDLIATPLRLYFSMDEDGGVRWDRIGRGFAGAPRAGG